jgi:NADPH:quinone reductase-like Zn-dependent oxidoreductase
MKGVHQSGYGGREALSICEFPRPTAGKGDVLIRVKAVSINSADHHMLTGRPYIMRVAVPLREIPGMDFSGIIESLGEETKDCKFAVGDQVFGTTDVKGGAFAEYVSVSYTQIVHKPKELDWETAASIPTAGMTALQGLRKGGEINKGDRVLINGASGGVGTFAVQLAKSMGAHVTGVCSTQNVELVRSLGANVVIDYKKEKLDAATEGGKYDKIIDIVGRHRWLFF